MHVAVTGASGFLGGYILRALAQAGHSPRVLGRRAAGAYPFFHWDPSSSLPPESALAGVDGVIHLSGEPVAQRWTREARRRILESRRDGTRRLAEALSRQAVRPRTLVSASAIGCYGSRGDEPLTEAAAAGTGFLPETCIEWEARARDAESAGIRVVRLRIGIVLGKEGGALAKMLPPFRAGVGGPLGSGSQWMSWIHVRDLARLAEFVLVNDTVQGAVNAVSPAPVTNREFSKILGQTVHRPAFLPVPAFALKLLFGEMAEVVLGSQRVLPQAAMQAGFRFEFTDLRTALTDLLRPA